MYKTFRFFFMAVGLLLTVANARPAFAQQPLPPNLEPLPAYDLALRPDSQGGTELAFSVLIHNSGLAALEINGGEITAEGEQEIYQRLYWDDGSFEDILAGTFHFHDEHGHIHVEDYSEYILEDETGGQSTRRGHKTSFCLLDTDKVDRHLPGFPKRAVYTSPEKDEISVEFDQEVAWEDALIREFYLDGAGGKVAAGTLADYVSE
jgi:hypothetical protein